MQILLHTVCTSKESGPKLWPLWSGCSKYKAMNWGLMNTDDIHNLHTYYVYVYVPLIVWQIQPAQCSVDSC